MPNYKNKIQVDEKNIIFLYPQKSFLNSANPLNQIFNQDVATSEKYDFDKSYRIKKSKVVVDFYANLIFRKEISDGTNTEDILKRLYYYEKDFNTIDVSVFSASEDEFSIKYGLEAQSIQLSKEAFNSIERKIFSLATKYFTETYSIPLAAGVQVLLTSLFIHEKTEIEYQTKIIIETY